jgi:hypothetical protein
VELVVERVDGAVQSPVFVADVGRADEGALLLLVLETAVLASVGHVLDVDVLLRVRAAVEGLEGGVDRSEGVVEVLKGRKEKSERRKKERRKENEPGGGTKQRCETPSSQRRGPRDYRA